MSTKFSTIVVSEGKLETLQGFLLGNGFSEDMSFVDDLLFRTESDLGRFDQRFGFTYADLQMAIGRWNMGVMNIVMRQTNSFPIWDMGAIAKMILEILEEQPE